MPRFDPTCEPNNEVVGVRRFEVITGAGGRRAWWRTRPGSWRRRWRPTPMSRRLHAGTGFGRNRSIPGAGWRTRAFWSPGRNAVSDPTHPNRPGPRILCRGCAAPPDGVGHQVPPDQATLTPPQRQGRAYPARRSRGILGDGRSQIGRPSTTARRMAAFLELAPASHTALGGRSPIDRACERTGITPSAEAVDAAYDPAKERIRVSSYVTDTTLAWVK